MAATFEPAGDFDAVMVEAVVEQMEAVTETVRGIAEANVIFPGRRSLPVESQRTSEKTWQVELKGGIGLIEEFGGTYSAPKAPLRRACEAAGLEFAEA